MFQMAQKEPARTTPIVSKPLPNLDKTLGESLFLSSGPEDCEPSVDPEDFGKEGVEAEPEDSGKGGVEVEPEDFGKGGVEVEPEDFGKGGVEVEPEDSRKGGVGVEVE